MSLSQTPTQDLPRRRRDPTKEELQNFFLTEEILFDDPLHAAMALMSVVGAIEKSKFLIHEDFDLDSIRDVATAMMKLHDMLGEEKAAAEAYALRMESRYE